MQIAEIKAVSLFGDAVELFDHPAVDGGRFRFGVDVEERKHLVEVGGAVDQVHVFADLVERLDDLVVLVPDLAHQLLDNVLQRHDAFGAAEFIDDDREMRFVLLQKL